MGTADSLPKALRATPLCGSALLDALCAAKAVPVAAVRRRRAVAEGRPHPRSHGSVPSAAADDALLTARRARRFRRHGALRAGVVRRIPVADPLPDVPDH